MAKQDQSSIDLMSSAIKPKSWGCKKYQHLIHKRPDTYLCQSLYAMGSKGSKWATGSTGFQLIPGSTGPWSQVKPCMS